MGRYCRRLRRAQRSGKSRQPKDRALRVIYIYLGFTLRIPVCWEKTGDDTDKGWIREALANTWEGESKVVFDGWGICTTWAQGCECIQDSRGTPWVLASSWMVLSMGSI